MVQCLSPCLSPMFIRCFGDLVVICCRAGEVGSLDLRPSRALMFSNISAGIGSVLRRFRPEGCDVDFRMMTRRIFCSACHLSPYDICPSWHSLS